MRLKELREREKFTQEKLAKLLKVSRSTVAMWEKGKNKPDIEICGAMADLFNVSMDYLLEKTEIPNPIDPTKLKYDNAVGYDLPVYDRLIKIPVLGTIRAGVPSFAEENLIGEVEIPAEWTRNGNHFFALKVRGDSMFPKYMNGDTVVLRQSATCENGQICAVLVNGDEATIKKVLINANGITLVPINNNYDPIFFSKKEVADKPVIIQGIVVRTIRDE